MGLAFLPLVGIQDDEVFFATAIFHLPSAAVFDAHVFQQQIPLMLLSYLGALKSWIYFPILTRIHPSYLTIRLPVLLIGTLTIWLFIWFLEKAHGRRVAWVGGVLLATDTVYVLTTCFDWGPVALQHLLSLAGLALLLKFVSSGKRSTLFWGFFLFGLAFWDKALFPWLFSGLAVATVVVFPRELWSRCTRGNLGLAAAGLIVGALPLVVYNLATNFDTFRSNSSFVLSQFPSRLHALRMTLDGEILCDYMVHAPWAPGQARNPIVARGFFRSAPLGGPRPLSLSQRDGAGFLGRAGADAVPLVHAARRTLLFCLIAIAVAGFKWRSPKTRDWARITSCCCGRCRSGSWQWRSFRPQHGGRLQWKHAGAILLAAAVVPGRR